MTTQSIIVYRNPAEAALWESGMVFPLICGMVIGCILAYGAATFWDKQFSYVASTVNTPATSPLSLH